MYTLYYYNESVNICTLEVETLAEPIICPENLFFIALRKGKTFITEPAECIQFTALERLYIRSFGLSSFAFKNEKLTNFRRQNTFLLADCEEGDDGAPIECPCTCDDEPVDPPEVGYSGTFYIGNRACVGGTVGLADGVATSVKMYDERMSIGVGTVIYDSDFGDVISGTFCFDAVLVKYYVLLDGVISEVINTGSSCLMEFWYLGIHEDDDIVHHPEINSWVDYIDLSGETVRFIVGGVNRGCQQINAVSIVDTNMCNPCIP